MNLLCYKNIDRVVVSEPDPAMLRKLKTCLSKAKIPAEIIDAAAESLPFPDASFDTVVSILVLCSVDDPKKAAAELRRVVLPGGVLLVLKHIKTDEGGLREGVQDAIVPLWRLLVGGRRCNRRSLDTLTAAGFEILELRRFAPDGVPYVTHPFVVATGRSC